MSGKQSEGASRILPASDDLRERIRAEAHFFNECAENRSTDGRIPYQADIRRATRVIARPGVEPVDAKMYEIQQGQIRERYLSLIAHKPGGRVLDIGCGPGWLALELGRRGQVVDAYDISEKAIAIARSVLKQNPFKEGFGQVNYHLQDVTEVDLGENTYDSISGWSAFHHMHHFHDFMRKIDRALKPGGMIGTMDDYPRRRREINLERALGLLLPVTDRGYCEKIRGIMSRISGKTVDLPEIFSPMEEAKYTTLGDIHDIWFNRYEIIEDMPFNAFSNSIMMRLAGPDRFRYPVARILDFIDKAGISRGVFSPQCRVLISRKRF